MLVRLLALAALALTCTVSCVVPPTAAELNAAKIGDCPDDPSAQAAVRWVVAPSLHDSQTALFEFPSAISRGYYRGFLADKNYAWTMPVYITDRSSFGGYGTKWLYEFYFVDDAMVAYGYTDYSSSLRTSFSMEFAKPVPLETFRKGQVPAERPRPASYGVRDEEDDY